MAMATRQDWKDMETEDWKNYDKNKKSARRWEALAIGGLATAALAIGKIARRWYDAGVHCHSGLLANSIGNSIENGQDPMEVLGNMGDD